MDAALETKLIECLSALDSGEPLEQILSRYPEDAAQLRPLLQTAAALPALRLEPSQAAKATSRRAFLAQAAALSSTPSKRRFGFFARPAVSIAALVAAFVLVGAGAVAASGSALPGDPLYGLKRGVESVRLSFAVNNTSRDALAAQFEQERETETSALLNAGREAEVEFSGRIDSIQSDAWVVAGLVVRVNDITRVDGVPLVGRRAHVRGRTMDGRLLATSIQVEPGSEPSPTPEPAATDTPKPEATDTPRPSDTPEPTRTPRPSDTPEPTRTPRPSDTPEPTRAPTQEETPTPNPSSTPLHTPEPTGTPSPTPEPAATDTPKPEATDTPRPSDTPEPTRAPRPSNTPEPTHTPAQEKTPTPNPPGIPSHTPEPTGEPSPTEAEFEFSGLVESIGAQTWTINGLLLEVSGTTEVRGGIVVGERVKVKALSLGGGRLLAVRIERIESDGGGNSMGTTIGTGMATTISNSNVG
jgi:hypothetical protein